MVHAAAVEEPIEANRQKSDILIEERFCIPAWVRDLDSFRRWAKSEAFPQSGRFSFLDGVLWVDLRMEELFTHNQVKAAFNFAILRLLEGNPLGRFVPDRMLLTNAKSGLSTEPDGLFYKWETIESGKLKRVTSEDDGCLELDGCPDIVIEIVSKTTVRKDTVVLRDLYWKTGIPEYWLVDVRSGSNSFEILRHAPSGYVAAASVNGFVRSEVLNQSFQLVKSLDPLGDPQFRVEMRV
jgi:Uma2 family endonuclease